jgi:hypothetical protein
MASGLYLKSSKIGFSVLGSNFSAALVIIGPENKKVTMLKRAVTTCMKCILIMMVTS